MLWRAGLDIRPSALLLSWDAAAAVAAVPGPRRFLAELSIAFVSGSAATESSLFTLGIVVALLVWGAMAAASSEA